MNFLERYKPDLTIYPDFVEWINNGNYISVTKNIGCNYGKFFNCITVEQLNEVIDYLFVEARQRAESFYEYTKTNIVYDGMVFGMTRDILNECIETNKPELKTAYLNYFGFSGDGIQWNKMEYNKSENNKQHFSKYPFNLNKEKNNE